MTAFQKFGYFFSIPIQTCATISVFQSFLEAVLDTAYALLQSQLMHIQSKEISKDPNSWYKKFQKTYI